MKVCYPELGNVLGVDRFPEFINNIKLNMNERCKYLNGIIIYKNKEIPCVAPLPNTDHHYFLSKFKENKYESYRV